MIVSIKKEYAFVPEVNGNKKLKKSEQVVVQLHLPAAGNAEEYTQYEYASLHDKDSMRMRMIRNVHKIINDCVVRIENFTVADENGEAREINSAKKLLSCTSPVASALVREIVNTVTNADTLEDSAEKN